MAFDTERWCNVAIGPLKVFTYVTGDMIATGSTTYFKSGTPAGLEAGDLIFAQYQNTGTATTALAIMAVKKINSTGVSTVWKVAS